MFPLTILIAQKWAQLLTTNDRLSQAIQASGVACNIDLPPLTSDQVVITSAAPAIGDKDIQLTYPRVCLYSSGLKNTQLEKFRTLSGQAAAVAEVWASSDLIQDADLWIHFYVEAVTSILQSNTGDWGDGISFPGTFDVQFQGAKPGGLGYVASAKVSCNFHVAQN